MRLARRPEWTTTISARRCSAGSCFVPDCERVRANGGAAPRLLQGRPRGREANPLLFAPARVFVPNPPGNPESAAQGGARLLPPPLSRSCFGTIPTIAWSHRVGH
jgi:hypothetical protein